jgi:hypothetical protein
MEKLGIELPKPQVNIAKIRAKYHQAAAEKKKPAGKKRP